MWANTVISATLLCIGLCVAAAVGHSDHDHGKLLGPIFAGNDVVPDVLDVAPTQELKVEFAASKVVANYGNELTPTQVKESPQVEWKTELGCFYTLLMVDPDAPSRATPTEREWMHWGVVNIPGANVTAGQTIAEYVGAGPPEGTGLHRYVLLVFKQEHNHDFEEPLKTIHDSNRNQFSTRDFAKKHGLGNALAGNLFQAAYDDYVPILHAQFQ